jgi:DNA mismatch repair protein MSH4
MKRRLEGPALPERFNAAGVVGLEVDEVDPHEDAPALPVDSIIALAENHHHEIGIACLRMSDFSVELSQFCDDQAYSKTLSMLTRHEPRQFIFPPLSQGCALEKIMKNEFSLARVEHVARKYWNELRGLSHIRHFSPRATLPALETDVGSRYLCLSALAALLDYAECIEKVSFVKGTLRLSYTSAVGAMLLDAATVRNLELLRNLRTGDTKASLFGVLSSCKTAAGTRLLRASIIQPSNCIDTINMRLDCVSELLRSEEALHDVQKCLPAFCDCDRVLKHFMQKSNLSGASRAQACISAVLNLKHLLRSAPSLAAALSSNGEAPPENAILQLVLKNLQAEELGPPS